MDERQMELTLKTLLTNLVDAWQNGRDKIDTPVLPAGMDISGIIKVATYGEAHAMTQDRGVFFYREDDNEFLAISVVKRY